MNIEKVRSLVIMVLIALLLRWLKPGVSFPDLFCEEPVPIIYPCNICNYSIERQLPRKTIFKNHSSAFRMKICTLFSARKHSNSNF
jgi:hypothetical protein